ncbi:MAG: hypothetical protein AAF657_17045 [Acidobacteriota bacterium]
MLRPTFESSLRRPSGCALADRSLNLRLIWAVAFWVPAVAGWAQASAEPPRAATSETAVATPAEVPGQAGLRVYLDPETGKLTSTPSTGQVEALSTDLAPLGWTSEGLEPFALHTGGRGVYLQGRFRSALTVRVTENGDYELRCVDGPGHAHPAADGPEMADPHELPPARPAQTAVEWVER